MTGSYCIGCGAERTPGARFCANCGAPVGAPAAPLPASAPPASAPPASPPPGATRPAAPPPGPWTAGPPPQQPFAPQQPFTQQPPPTQWAPQPAHPHPQPGQPAYPQAGYPQASHPQAGHPQGGWEEYAQQPGAQSPYPGQPTAAPWGAAPAGAPKPSGKSPVDALLTGDWGGAARNAGIAVGVMAAISLVGVLVATSGGIGFRETVALVFAAMCLAVGGNAYLSADSDFGGASVSLGLLPLTVTLAGLGLLGWLSARQLRAAGQRSTTDGLLQGVRTVLVFTVVFLPLSLLTRYQNDEFNALGLTGRLGVGVVSTVFGALLFAVAALGLTWLFHRSTVLPGRVGAFRDKARAPLVGALAVFAAGLLGVLVALVYGLVNGDEKLVQLGVAVLGAGNGALAGVLWSAGVPLGLTGNASASLLGELTPSGAQDVDLLTFTDGSGWFWLAPVVLVAVTVLVATALAVRQDTIEDARREGFRFAAALAVVAFLATLLLRIGVGGDAGEFGASASGSAMFNPVVAAVVLALWGIVTGLLAPVVGGKIGGGFVSTVRRRFGAANTPPPAAY